MKKIILFVAVFLFTCQYSNAQSEHGVAIRAVTSNHHWPISKEFLFDDFAKKGMEIEYYRSLSDYLNFSVPFRLKGTNLPLDGNGNYQKTSTASLDLLLNLKYFKASNFIYPYLYAGISGISENLGDEFSFAAPVGIGLNFKLADNTYLTTKTEYRIGFKDFRNNLQFAVGLMLNIGEGAPSTPKEDNDRDKDGVMNSEDLCPDVAGLLALNGCPDTDGDGVVDGEDQCPSVAGIKALGGCPDRDNDGVADQKDECPDKAGPISNNGCPLAADADKDGIPDANDDCPNKAGQASANGCPDADRDGVADKNDDCPNEAGPASTNGCPDTDSDGVLDKIDKCPNTPGPVVNNGCPTITKEDQETLDFAVQAVQFETARAVLKTESHAILDKIADIMKRNPGHRLSINGHTDSVGSRSDNLKLSEKRAKSCYDYLVSKGIMAIRMAYKGYGEAAPIEDNRFKAGREKNRRVEFNLFIE